MSIVDRLDSLPGIEDLRRRSQSLAALDAILCPEWEYRYFSFNATWAPGEMLSSMRNGEGDDWLILFDRNGAIMRGFAVGAKMAKDCPWPGVVDAVPDEFTSFVEEPAFVIEKTTFCLWRRHGDEAWSVGPIETPGGRDPDGSLMLTRFLDGDPETYRKWGEEYYGERLNPRAIQQIYAHERLTEFLVRSLNAKARLHDLREEIEEIGYPL